MLGNVPVTEVDPTRNTTRPSEALTSTHWAVIGARAMWHILTIPLGSTGRSGRGRSPELYGLFALSVWSAV